MQKKSTFFVSIACTFLSFSLTAQTNTSIDTTHPSELRRIDIVQASSLRQITLNDTTILQALIGNAIVRQGATMLSGDSIVLNKQTGIAEVFGNVHINDGDTVNTYSQYLKYIGNERMAYLKNKVQFSEGKATLFTDNLEYNISTGIANYQNGGKVVNEKTTLTSESGVYFSDTKDVIFKKNVHLIDAKYDILSDSLRYNSAFKIAYFIAPTHIKSNNGDIDTHSGNYNLQTGEALFLDKTIFKDKDKYISGNKIAFDEKSNMVQIEDNGKFVDSTENVIVIGNQILIDKKNNTFLATRKPVMIFYQKNDSTYVSADTLFSGKKIKDRKINNTEKSKDSLSSNQMAIQSTDSIRFFVGFHHVRIFNDSMQAVSDSLHYTTEDSTFKLFQNPICWYGDTQFMGDTMFLLTENKQPKEIKVFYNSLVINKTKEGFFNQVGGTTINGYINQGEMEHIVIKGNPAESIFYPQDEENAYTGMNKSKSTIIEFFLRNKTAHKIKYTQDVKGTLYPLHQIPPKSDFLKNFSWQEHRRPKHKLELFE